MKSPSLKLALVTSVIITILLCGLGGLFWNLINHASGESEIVMTLNQMSMKEILPTFLFWSIVSILITSAGLYFFFEEIVFSAKSFPRQLSQSPAEKNIFERAEKAEAASTAKGNFLANMSHEIRTPMNAVIGFSHLLKETSLDETQRDYVSCISASGTLLLGIINDILDFSKIEAEQTVLESMGFNLRELAEDNLKVCRSRIQGKSVKLDFYFDPQLPEKFLGDPIKDWSNYD